MNEKKSRGIVDPWRTVEPVHKPAPTPPARPTRKKIDLDEIDRDGDLIIPHTFTIRTKHVSFNITSRTATSDVDAFGILADCVADLFSVRVLAATLVGAGIGVHCSDRTRNAPSEEMHASSLRGGNSAIWFIEKPVEEGALVLAKIMRSPDAAATLHQRGVVIMLTTS